MTTLSPISWHEFANAQPELAHMGRRMLRLIKEEKPPQSFDSGLAYLATIRRDGGPRIHPISPALIEGNLYAFILNISPKQQDLRRDGRFALHSWPVPMDEVNYNDDEYYIAGRAFLVDNSAMRQAVAAACHDDPDSGVIFELKLQRVMHKSRDTVGTAIYRKWNSVQYT